MNLEDLLKNSKIEVTKDGVTWEPFEPGKTYEYSVTYSIPQSDPGDEQP